MNRVLALIARCLPSESRDVILGDLEEEWRERREVRGGPHAAWWLCRATFRACVVRAALDSTRSRSSRALGEQMRDMFVGAGQSVRSLTRRPLTTLLAILTIALGVGANIAMFIVAWPVLAGALPFPDEARLTLVSLTYPTGDGRGRNNLSVGDYNDLRGVPGFLSSAAFSQYTAQMNLESSDGAEQLTVAAVTEDFFDTLKVQPVAGRLFNRHADDLTRAIVLSEGAWRRRFGANPDLIGQNIRLDGESFSVIGVAPAWAGLGTVDADAWRWMEISPGLRERGAYYLGMLARLRDDTSLTVANQQVAVVMQQAAKDFPRFNAILSAEAEPLREASSRDVNTTMTLLVVAAGLVLLVAVVNLSGVQVARFVDRSQELAVRRAIGATRAQLAGLVMREQLIVAMAGGAVGAVLALAAVRGLAAVAPSFGWTRFVTVSSPMLAAYACVLSLAAAVVVGAWPSWKAGASGGGSLQTRAVTAGRRAGRQRAWIMTLQVAATCVLLIMAALVARSQSAVLSVETGFDLSSTMAADVNVPASRYPSTESLGDFFGRLSSRIADIPGVRHVCFVNEVPLGRGPGNMTYVPEGTKGLVSALPMAITAGCPPAFDVPLLSGRWFTQQEPTESILVSKEMARKLWPDGRDPVGQRVHFGLPSGQLFTIVGVTGDIVAASPEAGISPIVWMPQSLGYFTPKRLLVKAEPHASVDVQAVRQALRDIDPAVALANVRSIDDIVASATAPRRFALMLLGGFAVVAIVLSAVGVYGLLAHIVGGRRQEIGIRVALGASQSRIAGVVLLRVGMAVVAGVVVGAAAAVFMSRGVESLLFDVDARDVRSYAWAAAIVTISAGLAAWSPIRRALRIDPLTALRQD
ncbi:MAG: ABC transporter permease [Vicinamibacterales bacterium]